MVGFGFVRCSVRCYRRNHAKDCQAGVFVRQPMGDSSDKISEEGGRHIVCYHLMVWYCGQVLSKEFLNDATGLLVEA